MTNSTAEYVLVIEDLAFMRRMLTGVVRGFGYEVQEAENGTEGIRMMKKNRPALVILDLMMPDISGVEVCQWMRANEATENIPILICTGQQDRRDLTEACRAGATDVIIKPIDRRDLKQRLNKLLPITQESPPQPEP
jgi:two-component system phosphate regulon response regulator PhoB